MFLDIDEMKSVLNDFQMYEIADGDAQILFDGIMAGVSEVKSYFTASNQKQWSDGRPRYDIDAIFRATGSDRDAWVLGMCKTVAAYNICERCNLDLIYQHVKERYERVIDTLNKIAGLGEYKDSPTLTPDLPTLMPDPTDGSNNTPQPFRYGSQPRFNHE